MDFTVGIVSRNLATMSNFVQFRDRRNLHVFQGNKRNVGHFEHFEWLTVCHMSDADLVKQGDLSGPPCGHVASPNWRKIKGWWIKWIRVILSTNGNWTCGNEDKR